MFFSSLEPAYRDNSRAASVWADAGSPVGLAAAQHGQASLLGSPHTTHFLRDMYHEGSHWSTTV